ncbi:hypothetical protein E2I00_013719, partial [Balaenoptera physalus]
DVPKGAETFRVSGSSGVEVFTVYNTAQVTEPIDKAHWPLDAGVDVIISVDAASKALNDLKVNVSYFGQQKDSALGHSVLYLTGADISLDVDTGRTGKVKRSQGDKKTWRWGPEGYGAVLLVNCDRDGLRSRGIDLANTQLTSLDDLQDMAPMVLSCDGPDELFDSHKLVLNVPLSDSRRVGVFCARGGNSLSDYKQVLGPWHLSYEVERHPGERKISFYVEGLTFPDAHFLGLVSLSVSLVDTKVCQGHSHRSLFRSPLPVFRSVVDSHGSNEKFLKDMSDLASKANCKLIVCPWIENRNDRWIQDEMEFGYIEAPHKSFPVVFDSPRNRRLKYFPYKSILGPDFGYVTREIPFAGVSGLDSFGNLDVSPPVTVEGKEYPLGRILIGSSFPKSGGQQMAKVVRDFLKAQQVQAPVELYSDWLYVGHVDEFLSFVPTSDQKVNMVVLGKYLGIPKPFGPIINGSCCLEEKVRSLLEPLGLYCIFIDDYLSYHKLLGEIHCGT